jgi:hypothetical protein
MPRQTIIVIKAGSEVRFKYFPDDSSRYIVLASEVVANSKSPYLPIHTGNYYIADYERPYEKSMLVHKSLLQIVKHPL